MGKPRHIAIAGGGIIGLACALVLRRGGHEVTLFEAGKTAQEASWAAGGMLAAEDPENPPALLALSRYSRGLYDAFLQEIEELTGRRVPFRTSKTIQVLDGTARAFASIPLPHEEAEKLIPGLGKKERRYLLLEEASLDPRELCAALRQAVMAAGVTIREKQRVLSANPASEGVLLVTQNNAMHADAFVNACGAWAGSLNPSAGVAPCKGQMLVIQQPADMPLTYVLRSPNVYLIPRGDHRILVGATVEDAGYSKLVEQAALASLRHRAAALWLPAAEAIEVDSWAGLRPATVDALPVIGSYGEGDNARFLATGHFRNGILLAPGTAHIIADLLCGVAPAVDLASFMPLRSSISAVCDKHFAAAL